MFKKERMNRMSFYEKFGRNMDIENLQNKYFDEDDNSKNS